MQEKNEGKQRDKEKISFIEKYLRETDNWPEVKPGKVISFTKDDITITEDNTIWPIDTIVTLGEDYYLAELLNKSIFLKKIISDVEKEIGKHQIISEIDMQGFGFNKVSFGNELRIYRKITRTCIWEIYLNIIKPKELMIFQKAISRENKNSFSFKIKNLEEFRTLLIQLELI